MSAWLVVAGLLTGLGGWLVVSEVIPAGPSLRAAVDARTLNRECDSAADGVTVSGNHAPTQHVRALAEFHREGNDDALSANDKMGEFRCFAVGIGKL